MGASQLIGGRRAGLSPSASCSIAGEVLTAAVRAHPWTVTGPCSAASRWKPECATASESVALESGHAFTENAERRLRRHAASTGISRRARTAADGCGVGGRWKRLWLRAVVGIRVSRRPVSMSRRSRFKSLFPLHLFTQPPVLRGVSFPPVIEDGSLFRSTFKVAFAGRFSHRCEPRLHAASTGSREEPKRPPPFSMAVLRGCIDDALRSLNPGVPTVADPSPIRCSGRFQGFSM